VELNNGLAWCAGFYSGEGCLTSAKGKRFMYLRMSVSQKDKRVLEQFQNIVEAGTIYFHKRDSMHSLDIYKQKLIGDTINKLWPFLSEEKKEQVIRVYERVDNHNYSL
jgi:hypothetical protein